MRFLTPEEVTMWLNEKGQIEDAYHAHEESVPPLHVQCEVPDRYRRIECFVRTVLSEVFLDGDLLVQITDWWPCEGCNEFIFEAMRRSCGETRPIETTPGYLVAETERERAVAIFTMATCFGWKCYIYGVRDRTVFFNWEGDIFDFWSDSEATVKSYFRIMEGFDLPQVPKTDEPA